MHPILEAIAGVRSSLKTVATTEPLFMTTSAKAEALRELVAAAAQLDELRVRILAGADDLASATAAHDPAAWLADQTRGRLDDARADLALGKALERRYPALAAALRDGEANLAQARVIANCLDDLPAAIGPDLLARAEASLVEHSQRFGPRQLARLGRRILDVIAPHIADEAEAERLADLESAGRRRTRLTLRRCGDGTTRLSGLLPDAAATRLAVYLEAFTNPRLESTAPDPTVGSLHDPVARLSYPRKLGEAFCHFLESVDSQRLPIHAGDATTVIVTVPLTHLQQDLATSSLLTVPHVPGDDVTVGQLSASEARRLACSANIVPAVLGADSVPLDLGRTTRLFTPAQRRALLLRDNRCRAAGCTVPGTWTEAHHLRPWESGAGPTDLANGVLLCRHHHQRIHESGYRHERLPNGDIRFHQRR